MHQASPHAEELARELQHRLGDLVRTDLYTRVLYSTDGSHHQILPAAVAVPKEEEQIVEILEKARELHLSVIARGAGTSLAGQVVGEGLILDCFRYLSRILAVDPEAMTATVQPGVVCARLNREVSGHGLMYGPDPASADRATFGGMIGNNASGAHSITYGMTADHVLACDVVLSDGSCAALQPLGLQAAAVKASGTSLEAAIYRRALRIREELPKYIGSSWPQTWRRASGYGLNYLIGYSPTRPPSWFADPEPYPRPDFSLAPLLAGSEGTLAIIRRACVRLVPKPRHTLLVVLPFESIGEACDNAPHILDTRPSAVELVPRRLIDLARGIPGYARRLGFVEGSPEALLVVEYSGASPAEARSIAGRLAQKGTLVEMVAAQQDLWAVRKAGLGLLMSVSGDTKPIEFVEDVAVPVERLGEYVRQVDSILAQHGTSAHWYGHASAGCLHMRPLLNLKTAEGMARMESIASQVMDLVRDMRGALSGEHGDGLSRTHLNGRLFAAEIVNAFGDLKRAFDPDGILNPGKIVLPDHATEAPAAHWRYGPGYSAVGIPTTFAFVREGDLTHAVEDCNGAGVCLKEEGLMCPSFQATREEMHSTRGRANALRAAQSGRLPPGALTSPEMYQVLDLCLACKGCKAECPSAVDLARIKAEFLSHYSQAHGTPLRDRLFAEIGALFPRARHLSIPVNLLARTGLVRVLLEKTLGISSRRTLPVFCRHSFTHWLASHRQLAGGRPVVLFVDTYTETLRPEIGVAATKVLEAAGYRVAVAEGQVCCGRPMISKGMLQRARAMADRNLNALAPLAGKGMPVIGLEPSCLLTFRDEYLEFFPRDPRARHLGERARLIEEFLTEPQSDGSRPIDRLRFRDPGRPWRLHTHCYTKALVGSNPALVMLRATGTEVSEIPSGCCGMAGSFGYEVEHEVLSKKIGELSLLPAVRAASVKGEVIAAAGTSCRTQILDGAGVSAVHPIELVADALMP